MSKYGIYTQFKFTHYELCPLCGESLGDMDWTGCPHTCEYEVKDE